MTAGQRAALAPKFPPRAPGSASASALPISGGNSCMYEEGRHGAKRRRRRKARTFGSCMQAQRTSRYQRLPPHSEPHGSFPLFFHPFLLRRWIIGIVADVCIPCGVLRNASFAASMPDGSCSCAPRTVLCHPAVYYICPPYGVQSTEYYTARCMYVLQGF